MTVNAAIDSTLERESEFTQKKSTCVEAENIFKDSLHTNTVLDEIPEHTGERAAALKHQFDYNVRDSVKATLTAVNRHKWEEHEKGLVVQGNFLALAAVEKQDIVWKSAMYQARHFEISPQCLH